MSELTSEKIAKALKGAGLSLKKRIEKAQEAWSNEAIFFPNKDEFLFEWISSVFAKPNMKKMDDCCLVQLPYWNLLLELLQHYKSKDRSIPTIHVNFVASISTLLQLLYKDYVNKTQERIEFLTIAYQCLDILFSDSFNFSYRPAFEHVSSAVDQVLDSLNTQLELCSKNNGEQEALQRLCDIAGLLLKKFDSQLVLAANQKKIFLNIVEKSLGKLLAVRRRIQLVNDMSDIAQIITQIICHSLFHADTVLEFTSVLKDSGNSSAGNVKQTNYVVKLFDCLDNMMNKQNDLEIVLDTVDILPILLSEFLNSFRKKRNTSTSAMQDISRMAEFGMLTSLLNTLNFAKDKFVPAYLKTLCLLLQEALKWNIYTARNDDIGNSQLQFLNAITDDIVNYLGNTKKYDQSLVLDVANALLQIDFSLIETRIQAFWPIMLNSEESARDSCLVFAKSVLHTYSASRQIDVYITELIENIQKVESDSLLTMLKKPMFTREFLNEFSSIVSRSMPVAQYLGTFTGFQDNLLVDTAKDEHQSKKAKKEKSIRNWTTTLITMYFVEFIHALKLTQHQLKNFETPVMDVYKSFIKPCTANWEDNTDSAVLPALQIHSALSTVFFQIYISKFEASELEWLAQSYMKIFKKHEKADNMISRLVLVQTVNNILQHAYYATLLDNSSDSVATDLVNLVVDYLIKDDKNRTWYSTAQWNGSLLDLDNKYTLKVACWKLLSDEWFESIVRFVDRNRAEKLASIIHMSMMSEFSSSTLISVQLLNKILLRSANFYEAKCFKDCNIPIILSALIELFGTKLKEASVGELSNKAAEMISSVNISKTLDIEQKDVDQLSALMTTSENDMDIDADTTTTNFVNQLATLLKLLLLFPNECIEKSERLQIIYLVTLIDIWSVSCPSADVLYRMKVSLMCRGLQLKFIDYFSTHSIIGIDYKILEWLVSSNRKWTVQNTVEFENTLKSIEHETNRLDFLVLRKIISAAGSKIPDEHALAYFQKSLAQRTDRVVNSNDDNALIGLINFLSALNLVLANRKSNEESPIYAKSEILKISKFTITALETTKSTISTLFEQINNNSEEKNDIIAGNESAFKKIGHILHLTRLLQNYAHTVGPTADEVIHAKELSKTLNNLASPFIQFLQTTLSSKELKNNHVLHMTTDFIAAFCSILSRYQQIDATKRVLAAVWFVYSLVYNTGDEQSLETLSNAFSSWIQSLTKEQYKIILESFVEQAEDEAANRSNTDKEQHHLVYISFFSQLLIHSASGEKGRVRKLIPSVLLKLSLVAGKTCNLKYLEQYLKLLIQITGDQTYHMSDYDASIILSCAMQVAHPTAADRFKAQITSERANNIFVDVCSILSNFVSHHKEQVVYMMPPFIAFVQSLFHCFKSSHVSLVSDSRKRKRDTSQKTGRSVSLLQLYAPLDNVSAQRFARVLTTIPQKQHSTQKNAKSTQSIQKIISKHTPSLLIEYFTLQSNATMTIVNPSIKSVLANALYDILDMCSDNDRNFVLSCLDGSGKSLFKDFYNSWKENHKYSGQ